MGNYFSRRMIYFCMNIISFINENVLCPVSSVMLFVCGTVLFFKLKMYKVKKALPRGKGGISPVSALLTSLGGTLGVGNIVGCATAISLGGSGAVLWMMLSVPFAACLKYGENYLAVKKKDPLYPGALAYIGKLSHGRALCLIFALLVILFSFSTGAAVQVNSAAQAAFFVFGIPKYFTGIVFAAAALLIVLGGTRRVVGFMNSAMPLFCTVYLFICVFAIVQGRENLPLVLSDIWYSAFTPRGAAAGAVGTAVSVAVRHGIAKSLMSNEAGCGTGPFSHGLSSSDPVTAGRMGAMEVILDTLVFGGGTSLMILLYGKQTTPGDKSGMEIALDAAEYFLGPVGEYTVGALTVFFAFASLLCWAFYGTMAAGYISPRLAVPYTLIYSAFSALGASVTPGAVWEVSDTLVCLLFLVNTTALIYHLLTFRIRE